MPGPGREVRMRAQRRSRRPFATILTATVVAITALAGSAPATAQPSPEEVLSHFLCYEGTFADMERVPDVVFRDQFEIYTATVGAPRLLCNPVRKTRRNGDVTRIVDRRQHLKAYRLVTSTVIGTIDLRVWNQFGRDQRVTVDRTPVRTLVPTRKAPHEAPEELSHFLCYPVVIGTSIDRRVELKDQFDSFRTRVLRPRLQCNPTEKVHPPGTLTPRVNEFAHLLCYGIERHRLDPPQRRKTRNQFEAQARARAEVAALLCVPSLKEIIL
jgi:hypothetical protein